MTRRGTSAACILLLLLSAGLAGCRSLQQRFEAPEPELIYSGTAPGLQEGVLVIDEEENLPAALEPLDPDFSGSSPDLPKFSLLRVVGRERSNACRQTRLVRVSTSGRTATVFLEEQVPAAQCECRQEALPPRAWLVKVTGWVTRAEREVTDVVVPCDELSSRRTDDQVVQLMESSWDHAPGAEIVQSAKRYQEVLAKLGAEERAEEVSFEERRVVVVTGRPRENGCRRTKMVGARLEESDEAVFTIQEVYPNPQQICPMVYRPPKVFLYKVPASVERARVVTEERR